MFQQRSLKGKLYIGTSITLVGLVIVAILCIVRFVQIEDKVIEMRDRDFQPVVMLSDLQHRSVVWSRGMTSLILASNKQEQENQESKYHTRKKEMFDILDKEIPSPKRTEGGRKMMVEAYDNLKKADDNFSKVREALQKNRQEEALATMNESVRPFIDKSDKIIEELEGIVFKRYNEKADLLESTMTSTVWLISGLGIIVFIVALVFGTYIAGIISTPIKKLSEMLKEKAEQIRAASEQLTSASQALASSSNEQASAIEETSASMEEIGGMVENNLRGSERSAESAESVREQMGQLGQAMGDILKANDKIQALVKIIGEIGEKTKLIDEIVFQTKLLSFNASVEAERAGEHGRGFAVVAQEVGNLAQMSGKSALEISTIVKNSLKEAEAIVNENKQKVDIGSKISEEAKKKAAQVSGDAKQIVTSSKEQAEGIRQVNNAISQISKATQENAQFSEETANSSAALKEQAEALDEVVVELTTLVDGKKS